MNSCLVLKPAMEANYELLSCSDSAEEAANELSILPVAAMKAIN